MQSYENCNVKLYVGRKVTLHNAEGDGDWPGRLMAITPEGALVICDADNGIRGADWDHIDLNIMSDEIADQVDQQPYTDRPAKPVGSGRYTAVRLTLRLGDEVRAMDGLDGDTLMGRLVEITEAGAFIEVTEKGHKFKGERFGCCWEEVQVYPDTDTDHMELLTA